MSKLFDPDAPWMVFLSTAFDFACLNLLFLLCAAPVVTAGASLSALYGVMVAFFKDGVLPRPSVFLQMAKGCFRKVTAIWLLFLALSGVLWADFHMVGSMPAGLRTIAYGGLFFLVVCLLLTGAFFFPMAALNPGAGRFALLRAAFISSVAALPRAAGMVSVNALPLLLLLFLPKWFLFLSLFWLFFWFALSAFLCVKLAGGRFYLRDI